MGYKKTRAAGARFKNKNLLVDILDSGGQLVSRHDRELLCDDVIDKIFRQLVEEDQAEMVLLHRVELGKNVLGEPRHV